MASSVSQGTGLKFANSDRGKSNKRMNFVIALLIENVAALRPIFMLGLDNKSFCNQVCFEAIIPCLPYFRIAEIVDDEDGIHVGKSFHVDDVIDCIEVTMASVKENQVKFKISVF